jgi:GNAT superfamily N-acetyltransferase
MKSQHSRIAKAEYRVSTQTGRLNIGLIHEFLRASYWAKDIPRGVVARALRNSLCFAVFYKGQQVGFGRVITDRATFAYVADVFVLPEHRGRGVAQLMLRTMLGHRQLQGLRRWMLATLDAHGLYKKFGFAPLSNVENYMTIHDPDVYQRTKRNLTIQNPKSRKT